MDTEAHNHTGEAVATLLAKCPSHGTVVVVCPRCAGKAGGKRHKGTSWRRKQLHRDMETARRLVKASPVLKALIGEAEQLHRLCHTLGLPVEARDKLLADMISLDLALESADGEDD